MEGTPTPSAIFIFIGTILVSIYTLYFNRKLLDRLILHPWSVVRQKKYHLVITSSFVHADLMHLMFNMITFYYFAFYLEVIIGSLNFLILYFGAMIVSDISTIIKHRNDYDYRSLGASGAISGVLFSFIMFTPTTPLYILFIPIGIPAFVFGPLYLLYCWWASKKSMDYINHEAHLWGAVAGVIITAILEPKVIPYLINQIF